MPTQTLPSLQAAFAKHLFIHGYPLWNPDPDLLPPACQNVGLRIGDVGTVDERGRFDLFFNIFEPLPGNGGEPPNFPPIEQEDVRCDGEDIPPHEVASSPATNWDVDEVEVLDVAGVTRRTTEYGATLSDDGSHIILPQGAQLFELGLHHRQLFEDYAREHGADWLEGFRDRLGWPRSNSIYLLTGYYKTCSWSIASFSMHMAANTDPVRTHCKLVEVDERTIREASVWQPTGRFQRKIGPPPNRQGRYNQTIFIRAVTVTPNLAEQVPSGQREAGLLGRIFPFPRSLYSPAEDSNQEAATETPKSNVKIEHVPNITQASHPSEIINRYLLRKEPSAKIAVTHDSQWIAMLKSSEEGQSWTAEDLENRLEALVPVHYSIVRDKDTVHMGDKECESPTDYDVDPLRLPTDLANDIYVVSDGFHRDDRYDPLGGMTGLEEAILLGPDTLEHRSPGHPDRSTSLDNLAARLCTRYNQLGAIEDLDEAIVLAGDALELCPLGHPDRSPFLDNLATCLFTRYKQLGVMKDLDGAIVLARGALELCPPGHPDRSKSSNNLAACLCVRYNQLGVKEDLDEAIVFAGDALELSPPGHPDRSPSLDNLATCLFTRYKRLGAIEDLIEAIALSRDALALCPPGHHLRSSFLNNLAIDLSTRYNQFGAIEDLNEAIVLARDALELCPLGHPDRSMSLNTLSARLSTRYNQLGVMEDLEEAIVLARDALELCPPGHPGRSMSLDNLAACLSTRYKQLSMTEDLEEAIVLARGALKLRSPGHPDRSRSLNNLAIELSTRYNQFGVIEDLSEAIVLTRDALALCPPGHPDRSMSLNNLAIDLSTRYDQFGAMEDLEEAIVLARDALELCPLGHPDRSMSLDNLAACLSTRYKQLGVVEDLDEAIVLARGVLELRPLGHPDRSRSLNNLAGYLHTRFTRSGWLKDEEELFNLYAQLAHPPSFVSSTDLSAARKWTRVAEEFHHPTTLLAYQTSIRLLTDHVATLPPLPQNHIVIKGLTSSLAVDAFSACLRHYSPRDAVVLLEQGRGVFWSQLSRLRSSLDDVVASGLTGKMLADEFTQQTLLIRTALDSPGPDQHDRVYRLNIELQTVVTRIRELPGLSNFLVSPLFSDLQQAAREGPVIIVNASQYGCDALVVLVDRNPVHIPLSITKEGVRELSFQLGALIVRAKSMDVTRDLAIILRELWDKVVSPIVNFLQTVHPFQSRIWWCPTAEFSRLPLHAAGPFRKGQRSLADLYISSYTPTLTALLGARRHDRLHSASRGIHFAGIGPSKAKGEIELVSSSAELANIGQRVDGLASFTPIEDQEASIARVTEELGKNEWVHLACQSIPNRRQPFESAFALHDGHLTIERIIRCELENAQFAYLSASHTILGDEESPDEVIHLASAMQFAGFRSVIGTMWAVDDAQTNKITSVFYDNMIDECGRLDYTRAAFALNRTMKKLVDIPFEQRVLYVHLGA